MNVDFNHIDDQDVSSDGLTYAQWDANAQCNASAMAMEPQHQAMGVKFREKIFLLVLVFLAREYHSQNQGSILGHRSRSCMMTIF